MVKWVINACNLAAKDEDVQFSREAGGQASRNQKESEHSSPQAKDSFLTKFSRFLKCSFSNNSKLGQHSCI